MLFFYQSSEKDINLFESYTFFDHLFVKPYKLGLIESSYEQHASMNILDQTSL